jgi:hypothetical protein
MVTIRTTQPLKKGKEKRNLYSVLEKACIRVQRRNKWIKYLNQHKNNENFHQNKNKT